MKFDIIKIQNYTYLLHLSEGGKSKKTPHEINPQTDLIIDFSKLDTTGQPPLKAYTAFRAFASALCQQKERQMTTLFRLPFTKQFEVTDNMPVSQAINIARQYRAILAPMPVQEHYFSSATGKRNLRRSRQYDHNNFSSIRTLVNILLGHKPASAPPSLTGRKELDLSYQLEEDAEIGGPPPAEMLIETTIVVPVTLLRQVKDSLQHQQLTQAAIDKQYIINTDDLSSDLKLEANREIIFNAREVYRLVINGYLSSDKSIKPRLNDKLITAAEFEILYSNLDSNDLNSFESVSPRYRGELPEYLNAELNTKLKSLGSAKSSIQASL